MAPEGSFDILSKLAEIYGQCVTHSAKLCPNARSPGSNAATRPIIISPILFSALHCTQAAAQTNSYVTRGTVGQWRWQIPHVGMELCRDHHHPPLGGAFRICRN